MSRIAFCIGGLEFALVPWASEITGRSFTSADRAEAFAVAACTMLVGIGLRVFQRDRP